MIKNAGGQLLYAFINHENYLRDSMGKCEKYRRVNVSFSLLIKFQHNVYVFLSFSNINQFFSNINNITKNHYMYTRLN